MSASKILSSVLLFIIAGTVGFLIGRNGVAPTNTPLPAQVATSQTNSLFKSQSATIQGEIVEVKGSDLSVKSANGETGTFPISDHVVIYKFSSGSPQASASSDLKTIESGKQTLIALELMGDKYQISSISYMPPASTAGR